MAAGNRRSMICARTIVVVLLCLITIHVFCDFDEFVPILVVVYNQKLRQPCPSVLCGALGLSCGFIVGSYGPSHSIAYAAGLGSCLTSVMGVSRSVRLSQNELLTTSGSFAVGAFIGYVARKACFYCSNTLGKIHETLRQTFDKPEACVELTTVRPDE